MNKPPEKIKLSVIILNHNTRDLLAQCLRSLPIRDDFQVIVVDNGSSDGSVEMIHKDFPGVEVMINRENLGYTGGNNRARPKTRGKYVLFLNSDTEVDKGTLEAMVKFMDQDEMIGISTCLTLLPSGRVYYACHRGFPTPWNSLMYFLGLAKLFPKSRFFAGYTASYLPMDKIHAIDACSGTFLLIRRDLLEKLGWFDEDYFAYGEDIEMCYRAKELGYKVMFNPRVKIMHYWGASSGLKSTSKAVTTATKENRDKWNRARYEAMKIFYNKHYKRSYLQVFNILVLAAIRGAMYLRSHLD